MKSFKELMYMVEDLSSENPDDREFKTDVPSESWLNNNIEDAKHAGKNKFGIPKFYSTTAYEKKGRSLQLPVSMLTSVKGQRGEQDNIRKDDLSSLEDVMSKTKKLPVVHGKEYAPFIQISHEGKPYVNEGNHRIMAAHNLGWKSMPVEVRYHDGGEREAHKFGWGPEQLLTLHKEHSI